MATPAVDSSPAPAVSKKEQGKWSLALRSTIPTTPIGMGRAAAIPQSITMVPVMEAVSRAVCPHPVVTVSRVDSQGSVHPAYRAANRAAEDGANRTSGGTALCSTWA
jgi:hypothetical protein